MTGRTSIGMFTGRPLSPGAAEALFRQRFIDGLLR